MNDIDRLAAECDCHRYNFAHQCPHHGYVAETNPLICPDPDEHTIAEAVRTHGCLADYCPICDLITAALEDQS